MYKNSGCHQRDKDLLKSTNVTKTLSYKSKNSLLKCYPEELDGSIPRFISQSINEGVIAEIFGVIIGFSIMERREVLDLLEGIPVKELFVQPKIQSVLETIEYPGNIACHSEEKLWAAGNAGILKSFNFNKQFDALKQSSGATGASSTLKNVGVDKGPTDIGVTRTGDLDYGIKLENSLFIFKKI